MRKIGRVRGCWVVEMRAPAVRSSRRGCVVVVNISKASCDGLAWRNCSGIELLHKIDWSAQTNGTTPLGPRGCSRR